jgi:hypothetical protein
VTRRAIAANPFVGVNYIPDNTRMEEPPAYVLQRLHDFDNMLVLLPSRFVPFAYIIARRRQLSAGLSDKALEDTITQPDTKLCMAWGLIPISLMYKTGPVWNIDPVIASLKARDMWAVGGGEKAADLLDKQDEAERERLRKQTRDDMYARSGDAWRSYQARTGQRTRLTIPETRRGRRPSAPISGSTAGLGSDSAVTIGVAR